MGDIHNRNVSRRAVLRGAGLAALNYGLVYPARLTALQYTAGEARPSFAPQKWIVNAIQAQLNKPTGKYIVIAAHRGLWRDAPENSETAIRNSFARWEMIETDLRKTKDYATLNQLVITHDPEISRTTTGKGYLWNFTLAELQKCQLLDRYGEKYEGGNWYPSDSKGTPLNDRETGVGQKVLTIADLFRIHRDFISGTDSDPLGPLIIMDVKGAIKPDPEFDAPARGAFNTMNTAIKQILKLPISQRKALVFMVKFNLIADRSDRLNTRQFLESNVPEYGRYNAESNPLPRLMLVFNPEDGTKDPPNDKNFQSLLSAPYLSHFEMNQYYLGDGCQVYIDYLTQRGSGISTYSENAFFPQGVWDVSRFELRNQDFNQFPVDEREIPDYTIANAGVGLIVSERPAEMDAILRQYNLRNVPVR